MNAEAEQLPQNQAPSRLPCPPWDMYTVAVALFSGYILLPLLVANILTLIVPFLEPAYQIFIQQGVTLLSWVGIFAFLAWKYRGDFWLYLGLDFRRSGSYYLRETVLVMVVMFSLMMLLNLWAKLSGAVPEKPYEGFSSQEISTVAFFAVMTAPVLEEVVFRGFVQSTFYKISPPVRAVIFTCLLFVLFHGMYFDKVQALVYVLLLGLALGYWRERTQSVIPGILGHLFNNALASLALLMPAK